MVSYQKLIIEFEKRNKRKPFAYELCPRFEKCQINRCPLHPDYKKLKNDTSDPSQKRKKDRCITKDRRKRIAATVGLKSMGLTIRETSAVNLQLTLEKSKQGRIPHQIQDKKYSQREKNLKRPLGLCIINKSNEVRPNGN